MKKNLLILTLFVCKFSLAQYVFNFAEGKTASWSNGINWNGGVVPPLNISSVTITAPDNTDGWLCLLDVDGVTSNSVITVGKHTTFTIPGGITFNCHGSFEVDSTAIANVDGGMNILCPIDITNNGSMYVRGSIYFDQSDYCPGNASSFFNKGPLYVYGGIYMDRSSLYCKDVFWNKGTIDLGILSDFTCTGDAINDGNIKGGIKVSVKNLTNNGSIELTGTGMYGVSFSSTGLLINNSFIISDESIGLAGVVINNSKGEIYTTSTAYVSLENVKFLNYGYFGISDGVFSPVSGTLYNYGSFFYDGIGEVSFEMDIINEGWVNGGRTNFNKGSVINNN